MPDKKFSLIAILRADTRNFNKGMRNGGKSLNTFLLKATGAMAGLYSAAKFKELALDAVKLAGEAQGVERAFRKLNNPNLLSDLRAATKGTVNDMQLMKYAVQAKNFKIPLDQLATYFKFATNRAAETGESVDYLVNSLITGLGRKSALVMDNLGISAKELQDETKRVGDFGKAAGNIIRAEMAAAGDVLKTDAQRAAELNANLENQKVILGQKLLPLYNSFLTSINNVIGGVTNEINTLKQQKDQINLTVLSISALKEGTQERTQAINQLKKAYPAYFSNLNTETTKNEDLSKALKKVNEDYANRIVMAEHDKELGKVSKAEFKLQKERVRATQQLEAYNKKYGNINDLLPEITEKIKKFIEYQESGSATQLIAKGELAAYKNAVNFLDNYQSKLAEISQEKQGIEAAKNSILALLNVSTQTQPGGGGNNEAAEAQINTIATVNAEITRLRELQQNATGEELAQLNEKIKGWERYRETLEKLSTYKMAEPIKEAAEDFELLDDLIINDIVPDLEITRSGFQQIGDHISSTDVLVGVLTQSINGLTDAFANLFTENEAGFKDVVTAMLSSTQQILNMLLAQAIAGLITNETKKAGLIGTLLASTIGLSIFKGVWASKVPKFAGGGIFDGTGIVPGTSYSGDKVNARLNSREAVFNLAQQKNLMAMANGAGMGSNGSLTGRLVAEGGQLVALVEYTKNKQNAIS